ncbi:MAG: TlpA family protein disulfide reductase [Candidatus Eisenbacteria bacterium]|nr:TlpA family protein disulfide reductase [Candidatus Eisenbacteria bacterium]
MTRRLTALLGALLMVSTPATTARSAAAAAPVPDAAALLDSVSARYLHIARFDFSGQTHVEISGPGMPQKNKLDIPFRFAAVRPLRLHTVMQNPMMPSQMVSDGDTLWTSAAGFQQYTAQAAPQVVPGRLANDAFERSLDPLQAFARLNAGVSRVEFAGMDTVTTAAGAVRCRKVVATYSPDSTPGAPVMLPRVLWVDEARRLVLRDSLSMLVVHPQMGELSSVQDTRFVRADDATGGPDSLYRFTPPAGSNRVDRIGASAASEGPDRSGQPASDFTLAALEGKSVTLSKLKGKVVVLDFWATWCGPCRRWMPIVEKVTRELAPKGVVVYAVNVRETPAQVRAYLTKSGVKVPVLLDKEGAVATAYNASSIPLTVIVGRDGKIVKSMVGVHSEEDLRAALRKAGVQ